MKAIEGETEEQLAQVFDIIRKCRYMILTCIDKADQLVVIRKAIPEQALPDAMRYYADMLEKMQQHEAAEALAATVLETTPPDRKSVCPACNAPVILVASLPPPEMMANPDVRARCVCTCGSFLVPYYDESGALALRIMSIEEIAELPDEVRNRMISVRNDLARALAHRRRAN